ncbi:MAG: NAD-dependent epimerase/dehydratase family protein [Proteobacteria bacterium]|nr:NAD-dependent epimerase/dehydratase family protein [Pseudomonadota bacterium]NIS71330.1 NAD-dependent epimerase/dehydratase family protein [Pseudomonadota bacterium]
MALYLVTGGAGFIGSHIVEELVAKGETVRVLDNFSTGKRENLDEWLHKIELIEGSVEDRSVCKKAVQGVEFVLHQAAICSVPRSVENPIATNTTNVTGTLNLLWVSKEVGVHRFVCAGSSSVYGDSEVLPKNENMSPTPCSPYAVSKLVKEHYCELFYRLYRLETVVLRYFNVYGSRQDPDSPYAAVIPSFVQALISGKRATIYGDGEQSRDFTYVKDCVQANLMACQKGEAAGEILNIASGRRITINQLYGRIASLTGKKDRPAYDPPRPGDVRHSLADISKAEKLLGYEPEYTIDQGLREAIQWYKQNVSKPS